MLERLTQDLSLDALLFFGTHSLLVVAICAGTFFSIGLWVGYLTWAKFKRRARAYYEEIQLQRSEIANLKRRITQESVDSLPTPTIGLLEATPLGNSPAELPQKTVIPTVIEPKRESLAETVLKRTKKEAVLDRIKKATVLEAEISAPLVEVKRSAPEVTPVFKPIVASISPLPSIDEVPAEETSLADNLEPQAAEPVVIPVQPTPLRKLATRPLTQALAKSVEDAKRPSAPSAEPANRNLGTAHREEAPNDLEAGIKKGHAAVDEKLGIVYHKRPERYDDLTLLRGVGEALQTKLHELGIYTFRQIAQWTDDNIHELDIRLAAKDRIRREQWVKQARNLHFLKYGEQLKAPLQAA